MHHVIRTLEKKRSIIRQFDQEWNEVYIFADNLLLVSHPNVWLYIIRAFILFQYWEYCFLSFLFIYLYYWQLWRCRQHYFHMGQGFHSKLANSLLFYFIIKCEFWKAIHWISCSYNIFHICKILRISKINSYIIDQMFKF